MGSIRTQQDLYDKLSSTSDYRIVLHGKQLIAVETGVRGCEIFSSTLGYSFTPLAYVPIVPASTSAQIDLRLDVNSSDYVLIAPYLEFNAADPKYDVEIYTLKTGEYMMAHGCLIQSILHDVHDVTIEFSVDHLT